MPHRAGNREFLEKAMSWLPDKDPVLGDKHSCDALELIVIPRVRDLGDGFSVRRALPHSKRQMVCLLYTSRCV